MANISGLLLGDQRADKLYLLRDLNGNGDALDAGERITFFDGTNAGGYADPTSNIFGVFQDDSEFVYFGDGNTDAVYRLKDGNSDGDANDLGEATVFFDASNAAGLSTVTPQSIAQGADGAIYLSNAGVSAAPQDAIYRLEDLNGDGDANDDGEATVWLDLQAILTTDGLPQGEAAVPYDIVFNDDIAYINDLNGAAQDDVIHRAEDLNGDGQITADEVKPFISDSMNFGAPVDLSSAVRGDSLLTLTWFPSRSEPGAEPKLYVLTDWNGSGDIDVAYEAREIWNASELPEGYNMFVGFNVTTVGNKVYFTADEHVIELSDVNGDGDFLDNQETIVFTSGLDDEGVARPRALSGYEDSEDEAVTLRGTNVDDRQIGGAKDDTLKGGRGDDLQFGQGGDDILNGGRGDDVQFGGDGDDTLRGCRGDDELFGGNGDDHAAGGRGDDQLTGGEGNDILRGGRGDDRLDGGDDNDMLTGGRGADVFVFNGGSDRITDFRLEDTLELDLGIEIAEDAILADFASVDGSTLILDFGEDAGSLALDNGASYALSDIDFAFV
ncbi:calcium-binding protein [Ruegeria sp. ANG-R]|uniref:calcium-binding protein n=1 Tax=Ruegeria sp. ANG-R TaxID=1577903 RepID=UPI0006922427|nr:calcium-binding protein [Ruegeria sp. ANG-R]